MVGSANGRSISALMADLPQKSSRTSTQAKSVPATAFTSATPNEATRLSRKLASADALNTSLQNDPPMKACAATAASGNSTITLRNVVTMPAGRNEPRRMLLCGAVAAGLNVAAALMATGDPERPFDLRDLAVLRVKEPGLHHLPSAEEADVEQRVRLREMHLRRDVADDRPVAVRGEDRLRLRRVEEVDERLRLRGVLRTAHDGGGIFDEDRLVRHDEVDVGAVALCEDGFAFVGEHHVALT